MLMSKKLKLGQPGTKLLVTQYGAHLVYMRCHYDAGHCNRFKTIELKNVSYSVKPNVSVIRKLFPILRRNSNGSHFSSGSNSRWKVVGMSFSLNTPRWPRIEME